MFQIIRSQNKQMSNITSLISVSVNEKEKYPNLFNHCSKSCTNSSQFQSLSLGKVKQSENNGSVISKSHHYLVGNYRQLVSNCYEQQFLHLSKCGDET